MHCQAAFYGPTIPPNTGFMTFTSLTDRTPEFRITSTGTVLELGETFKIVKKLKLIGYCLPILLLYS